MQTCNVEQQRCWQGHQASSLLPNIAREKTQASIEIFNVVRKIIANNGEKDKQLELSVFCLFFWTKFMENGTKSCMLPKYFLKRKVQTKMKSNFSLTHKEKKGCKRKPLPAKC